MLWECVENRGENYVSGLDQYVVKVERQSRTYGFIWQIEKEDK